MGKQYKPESWETVFKTIRYDIETTIDLFERTEEFILHAVKTQLPFGISNYNNVDIVTWKASSFRPHALFHISRHSTGRIQRIELEVGKPIYKNFPKNKKYRYTARRGNPLIVSQTVVSLENLEKRIQEFIAECNNIIMLYCE